MCTYIHALTLDNHTIETEGIWLSVCMQYLNYTWNELDTDGDR